MDDILFSEGTQVEIDDLFGVDAKEVVEGVAPPEPIKEEETYETVNLNEYVTDDFIDLLIEGLRKGEVELVEPKVEDAPEPEPEPTKPRTLMEDYSHVLGVISKNLKTKELVTEDDRLTSLETQLIQVRQLFREATMVSGIGQGGDGQTPGSGVVKAVDLDDVNLDGIQPGDQLIWDGGQFVPSNPDDPDDHIFATEEYVDTRDEELRQQIITLDEELESIVPSIERGQWTYNQPANAQEAPAVGKYFLIKDATTGSDIGNAQFTEEYVEATGAVFNYEDQSGTTHTFADIKVEELIDLLDNPDPDGVFGQITEVDVTTYTNAAVIFWDTIKSLGSPTNNAPYLTNVKVFQKPTGGEATDFVKKTGDNMTGDLTLGNGTDNKITLDATDGSAIFAEDVAINSLTVGCGAGNVASNTAVGSNALNSNTTGSYSTALGHTALNSNTTGIINTAVGSGALYNNTTGKENTAVGQSALYRNETGSNNIAIGRYAGYYIEGDNNTVLGAYLGAASDASLNDTVIISAGLTERMRIKSDGNTEFYGKVTSASTEASDSGTTLVTKDYVDSKSGAASPTPVFLRMGPFELYSADNTPANLSPDGNRCLPLSKYSSTGEENMFVDTTRYYRISKNRFEAAFPDGIENYTFMPGQMLFYGAMHRQSGGKPVPSNQGIFMAVGLRYQEGRYYEIEVNGACAIVEDYKVRQNKYVTDSLYQHWFSLGCFWKNS